MVLPLLGLLGLGVGLAAKPYYERWSEGIEARGRAKRMEEGMGGLLDDPEATQLDIGKGLLRSGNISGSDFLSGAFDQENLFQEFGLDQLLGGQEAERAAAAQREGRLFDLGAQFQPRFDALDTQLADLGAQDRIVSELLNMGLVERDAYLGTPEGIAAMNQLAELEEREWSTYKRRVYGDAEPNPEELARVRSTYFGALGGGYGNFITGGGRMEQAREVFDRRATELERQKSELTREYQRNLDRIDLGGVQTRGPRGGVGVTASGRNAPPGAGGAEVGPAAMAIAQELLGAGEVPDRELLSEFMATGGEGLDPVTTAWCAAFLNGALERAGGRGTGSNLARSFLDWGEGVDEPRPGDVAVFSRGSAPWAGHAGFFQGYNEDGTIRVLGGNQGDAVGVSSYPAERLLGFRRGR